MKRTAFVVIAVVILSAVVAVVIKLRSSRASNASLERDEPLAGSLDTWPVVQHKQVA